MKWLLNLSTGLKLSISFGVMLVFLSIVIGTAYTGITSIQASQRMLYENDFDDVADLQELLATQNEVRASMLNMMMTASREEQDSLRRLIGQMAKDNGVRMASLVERNHDDAKARGQLEHLRELRAQFGKLRDEEIIPLIYQGKIERARQLTTANQTDLFVKIPVVTKALIEYRKDQARSRVELAEQEALRSSRSFEAAGAAALAIGILLVTLLNRVFAHPLNELAKRALRIASGEIVATPVTRRRRKDEIGFLEDTFDKMTVSLQEKVAVARQIAGGDLTVKITPQSEQDALGLAFAAMAANLRNMHGDIREGINVLAASASQILAGTSQLAASTEQTAAAIAQTSVTVEEVKQTALLSSQKANYVSETAQTAAQVSQTGRKSVEGSIEGILEIREQTGLIADSIIRLSEQSQAIGEIMVTVSGLSEQSNLLAVNASIEAAKAGDWGRGFAVVAQEVKSLAAQSKQATAQVRGILGDIQKATGRAVLATEQGNKAVEAGVKQSKNAGEAIVQLAESITESAQAVSQIAVSARQQLAGMDQLGMAMESIKEATAQNVGSTRQSEAAAHSLHELGQKLKKMIEQYKV